MSLIPTVFRSTDPGAPVLSGSSGSFSALLDAVLVDGYGVGGAAKEPLGWVRAFSEGQKRSYRNSIVEGGTGMYVRFDDANAQYVLVSGYHSMSGIDGGVDQFAGAANAWPKSITANSVARSWVIVGNARSVYVFIDNGVTGVNGGFGGFFFGDYGCIAKSYAFNFGITYSGSASWGASVARSSLLTAGSGGGSLYGARSYSSDSIGSELQVRPSLIANMSNLGGSSSGAIVYPYAPTGGMLISRVSLNNGGLFFGVMPGLWAPEHNGVLVPFNTYEGLIGLPLRPMLAVQARSASNCQGLLQLNEAWEY